MRIFPKISIAAVLATGALTLVPFNSASADDIGSCPDDQKTESGVCVPLVPSEEPTASQRLQIRTKQHDFVLVGNGTTQLIPDPIGVGDYKLPEVDNMTIYKEGEGNGKKSYTCGPSSTRNMVAAMYKHRDGYYKDFGEAQFATWEGTTTEGTSTANIATTLNNHFSAFGHWATHKASSKDDYISKVSTDTYGYHQSVIVAVDTEELAYFNGKALNHINFDYGWDDSSTTRFIYKAEEWDPIFIYGASSYGNPYGKHKVPLAQAFNAEDKTSYHYMVV